LRDAATPTTRVSAKLKCTTKTSNPLAHRRAERARPAPAARGARRAGDYAEDEAAKKVDGEGAERKDEPDTRRMNVESR
jgi:hypothetical protein